MQRENRETSAPQELEYNTIQTPMSTGAGSRQCKGGAEEEEREGKKKEEVAKNILQQELDFLERKAARRANKRDPPATLKHTASISFNILTVRLYMVLSNSRFPRGARATRQHSF